MMPVTSSSCVKNCQAAAMRLTIERLAKTKIAAPLEVLTPGEFLIKVVSSHNCATNLTLKPGFDKETVSASFAPVSAAHRPMSAFIDSVIKIKRSKTRPSINFPREAEIPQQRPASKNGYMT